MTSWHHLSVSELGQALNKKEISSVALTEHFLKRIEEHNKKINCFIEVTPELALTQAHEADKRLQAGESHPLLGIPFAHKDIFCVKGVRTTCGSKMLGNFISPYNATVTERLFKVGMVHLGKANMDEFAMGSSNETSAFGPCLNPFDLERVPGGSSGGSASAVAAGLAPCATGSDTGGSIRQPASYCHLVGLLPTYGRVSRFGMIAFASSLDQGGPITQTVEDAAYMLDALCGYDPKDSTSSQQSVPFFSEEMKKHPKDLKIAIPRVFIEALDTATQQQFQAIEHRLHDLGMKTEFIDFDIAEVVIPTYYVLAPAEASSNLARYDGVRYGHRSAQGTTLKELYKNSRGEGFGDEVKRRILMGTYVLSSGHYDAYYQRAQKIRLLVKKRFAEIFQKFDLVATPTALSEAFKLKAHEHDPVAMYYSDLCTVSTNLASLPAISLPLMQRHGLPLGFQLIGKSFDEATLLQVGYAL